MSHLQVERKAHMLRAMRRVSLDELVVEECSWVWNIIKHFVGIGNIRNFYKFGN